MATHQTFRCGSYCILDYYASLTDVNTASSTLPFSSLKMESCLSLKAFLLLLCLWHSNFQVLSAREKDTLVELKLGAIRGKVTDFNGIPIKQYLGIPYAQPPVDELRFRKPQPLQRWNETYVADKMSPACIQYNEYPFPWKDFGDGMSEDCLYLNIWVPTSPKPTPLYPVMFWIYGGGFTVGSNRKPLYDGGKLASFGKVVVVTINYRMSALGFLTAGTEAAPGNQGIYDMVAALKFVNENIQEFGGDPNAVTLAGQSSGSIAVGLLSVSPLTEGLYRYLIMESGSPAYLFTENNTLNVAKSQLLAEALGCADDSNSSIYRQSNKVVNCLRELDAIEIAKTENSFHPKSARSFFPMYGDEVLPMNARKALIEGKFRNASVLIGNNKDEGSFQITTANPDVFGFFGEKDPKVNKSYAKTLLRGIFEDFQDPEAVIEYYLGNVSDDDYDKIREQVYTASGDYSLLCPAVYFAESYARKRNNVFFYYFTHRPTVTPWAEWMGTAHFEEVQFVFGIPLKKLWDYRLDETNLSYTMLTMWCHFVKYGHPGRYEWPLYTLKAPIYATLKANITNMSYLDLRQGPHSENCSFFRPYFGFKW